MRLPKIGEVLDGRYRIEKEIGRGGMGAVFLATHTALGSQFAIKVHYTADTHDDPTRRELQERFLTEGKLLAQLEHPGLVNVTDVVSNGELSALVMKYYDAPTLELALEQRKNPRAPYALRQIVALATLMLEALTFVHSKGVVHRDLKPSNVLLTRHPDGGVQPVIIDFGIAKVQDPELFRMRRRVVTNARMGTPDYMSPEQALGLIVDARTDLFALGLILYEMATLCPVTADVAARPVGARTFDEMIAGLPPIPNDPNEAVTKVLKRALATNPDDRFANATQFSEALRAAAIQKATPSAQGVTLAAASNARGSATVDRSADRSAPFAAKTPSAGADMRPNSAPAKVAQGETRATAPQPLAQPTSGGARLSPIAHKGAAGASSEAHELLRRRQAETPRPLVGLDLPALVDLPPRGELSRNLQTAVLFNGKSPAPNLLPSPLHSAGPVGTPPNKAAPTAPTPAPPPSPRSTQAPPTPSSSPTPMARPASPNPKPSPAYAPAPKAQTVLQPPQTTPAPAHIPHSPSTPTAAHPSTPGQQPVVQPRPTPPSAPNPQPAPQAPEEDETTAPVSSTPARWRPWIWRLALLAAVVVAVDQGSLRVAERYADNAELALYRHKTNPKLNSDKTYLGKALGPLEDMMAIRAPPRLSGLYALLLVQDQKWHWAGKKFDENEFGEADRVTSEAISVSPTIEGLLARALLTSRACKLAPARYSRRSALCEEAQLRYLEATERLKGDSRSWLKVEVWWTNLAFINHLSVVELESSEPDKSQDLAERAAKLCETAKGEWGAGAVNNFELGQECLLAAGLAGDYTEYLSWGERLMTYPFADEVQRIRAISSLYKTAHSDCAALKAPSLDHADYAKAPRGEARGSNQQFCIVARFYALGCTSRAERSVRLNGPKTQAPPWTGLIDAVRQRSTWPKCPYP